MMKSIFRIDQFKNRLKAKGLKATPQRLAVHEAMIAMVHASADMVRNWISARNDVSITTTSVYNILEQLSRIGIYKRRLSSDNKMYFDVDTSSHVHLYDSVNDEFRDIPDQELTDLVEAHFKKRKFRGFKIDQIDVQVICHPTKRKKEQE